MFYFHARRKLEFKNKKKKVHRIMNTKKSSIFKSGRESEMERKKHRRVEPLKFDFQQVQMFINTR